MTEAGRFEQGQKWSLCRVTVDKSSWVLFVEWPESMDPGYAIVRALLAMNMSVVVESVYFH
jgi:hypothetical protein